MKNFTGIELDHVGLSRCEDSNLGDDSDKEDAFALRVP